MQADAILEPAASRVRDPASGRSLWLAGLLSKGRIEGDTLSFTLNLSRAHSVDDQARLREALLRNIEGVGWKGKVVCDVAVGPAAAERGHSHDHGHGHDHGPGGEPARPAAPKADAVKGMSGPGMQPHGGPIEKKPLDGVRHVIAVASGKGGVGKSTVATNLAVALRRQGWSVGLMDADIYGPSLPMMMNVRGKPFANKHKRIIPLESYGVKCMSIGFLVDDREPVIWRGPMVMGVVRQFLQDVDWSGTDVLVIDLPPGTGDAQLTMIQAVQLSGAVIVTTPQDVAVLDAVRGVEMFKKLDVPILGIVENMSWLDVPGSPRLFPFGSGGGQRTANEYGVPLLAQVPLNATIREGGDKGTPAALNDDPAGSAFFAVASAVAKVLAL
jgi:ATP-binding protein involved in chromosome partitioning